MARSSDINQRVVLVGSEEVRQQLEAIGKAGERSGDQTQRAFTAASGRLNSFAAGARAASASSGQMRFALQNLSFQVNDVATSLASGGDVMRVFAQQGGQIFQAFQQGGGFGTVLGGVATKLREMITPLRVLAGVGAAAAAGVAVLSARVVSSDNAIRQFKVTLDALKPPVFARGGDVLKGFGVTPEKLEEAAKRLRAVGLSVADARKEILDAVQAGIDPRVVEQVVKFGKDLDAAFGEKGSKSAEAFKKAIAGGPAELRKFGVEIGRINPRISELQDGLRDIPSLLRVITNAPNIKGAADNVLDPVSRKARDINVEFQNILDKMSLFGKEGFVNLINTGSAALDVFKALGTAVKELNFTGLAEGFAVAFEPVKTIAIAAFDAIRARLAAPDPLGITALATAATANVQQLFATLGQTAMDALVSAFGSTNPFEALVSSAQSAFQSILDTARQVAASIAAAIRSAFSTGGAGPEFTAPIPPLPGRFAAGGMVRGPGGPTSDSVPAWLSAGEYVINAFSARRNLPLLEAINAMRMPAMPRMQMPRGFAMGGLVTGAAGGGTPIYLTLSSGSTVGPMMADSAVTAAVMREGRRATMLSAGRKPSSVGGRRYGG